MLCVHVLCHRFLSLCSKNEYILCIPPGVYKLAIHHTAAGFRNLKQQFEVGFVLVVHLKVECALFVVMKYCLIFIVSGLFLSKTTTHS
jgi:hypothetical protein